MTEKLTINEAAKVAGKSPRTIRRWIHGGELKATLAKRGDMDIWHILPADLAALIGKPTYDDLASDNERIKREFLRFINKVEAGNVAQGDITRARNAIGASDED